MDRQIQNLIREARIRKGIILYGNTRDEFFNEDTKQYHLFPKYLQHTLKRNGFDVVGLWNKFDGLSFLEKREKSIFSNWFTTDIPHQEITDTEEEGEDFDIGMDEGELHDLPPLKNFDELVAGLTSVLEVNDRPATFILDWTDFQFGTVQTPLTPEDRSLLFNLGLLMTGVRGTGKPQNIINKPPCVVILITATLGSIPPVLYQPEPRIKLFNLSLPDRVNRVNFFDRHFESIHLNTDPEKTRKRIIDDLADMTEGFKLMDLIQIVRLGKEEQNLSPEKLINLYRFGQRRSPWEDLSDEKLLTVEDELKQRVVGQDHAVQHLATIIIKAAMGLSGIQHSAQMTKPKGVLFFVGPTGVGKTELAKAAAEFLFGDESACIRFDMSEYSHEESDQRLIGAPPGFVGFEEGGQLTNAVIERPFSVLLFDEIEKSHPRILDKFLQILEDGRLTDGKGVTAYFSETVIIFTSNIGSAEVDHSRNLDEIQSAYLEAVKNHFNQVLRRPELLNRIGDNIIVFNTITNAEFRQEIIKRKLKPLKELIKSKYGITLLMDNEIFGYFEKRAVKTHGGRGLLNAAERDLINPLSMFLFNKKQFLDKNRSIHVKYEAKKKPPIEFEITEE
ncbi:MAG: AAA family ATPase [Candidatus Hodarchaeota archaeon]